MRRSDIEGRGFPPVEAVTLSGLNFFAPDPGGEQAMLLYIAFKRGAQEQIDAWSRELRGILEKKDSIPAYEVPMLAGRWRLLSGVIDGGMRSGIPEAQHDFVATFYGDVRDFKNKLDIKDEDSCYVLLLDSAGIIRFAAQGGPTTELSTDLKVKLAEYTGE